MAHERHLTMPRVPYRGRSRRPGAAELIATSDVIIGATLMARASADLAAAPAGLPFQNVTLSGASPATTGHAQAAPHNNPSGTASARDQRSGSPSISDRVWLFCSDLFGQAMRSYLSWSRAWWTRSVLAAEVECPVRLEVPVVDDGAEPEDGLGSLHAPPGAGDVEAVADQVAARAFDDSGGDRPAGGECLVVAQVLLVVRSGSARSVPRRSAGFRAQPGRWRPAR